MEPLLPIDLDKVELSVRLRGYDRDEVQKLMQKVAAEMDKLRTELAESRAAASQQRVELEEYRAIEDTLMDREHTLKQVLIQAHKTADETRANAKIDAELIEDQGRQRAEAAQREAEIKLNDIRWDLERLRLERQKFINNFRDLLESHLQDLAEQGGLSVVQGDRVSDDEVGS